MCSKCPCFIWLFHVVDRPRINPFINVCVVIVTRGSVVSTAEKVSSLGKDWHKFCLKCERCNKTLNPGGHAEVSPPSLTGAVCPV